MASPARFALDLSRFAERIDSDYGEVIAKTSIDLLGEVVKNTPVDTGAARGAWTVGVNSEPTFANTLSKPEAPRFSEVLKLNALSNNPFSLVVIGNNLPYITALENGSSNQSPTGMVRRAINTVSEGIV